MAVYVSRRQRMNPTSNLVLRGAGRRSGSSGSGASAGDSTGRRSFELPPGFGHGGRRLGLRRQRLLPRRGLLGHRRRLECLAVVAHRDLDRRSDGGRCFRRRDGTAEGVAAARSDRRTSVCRRGRRIRSDHRRGDYFGATMQATQKLHSARARFRKILPGCSPNRVSSAHPVVDMGTSGWLLVGCRLGGRGGGGHHGLHAILSGAQQQVNESDAGRVSSPSDAHRRLISQAKAATTSPAAEAPPPPEVFYGRWERYADSTGKPYYLDLKSGEAVGQLAR